MADIRVLVVDDHQIVRDGLVALLGALDGMEVVGSAADGREALHLVASSEPDVVVMDIQMPALDGIEATRFIAGRHPDVRVVVLTMNEDDDTILSAIRAGASGYLLKGTTADKMIEAIKEVKAGGTVIQPSLARRLLKHFRVGETTTPGAPALAEEPEGKKLSARETEILQLIAKGISNNEAAQLLSLSKATIRTHLEHIYRKLEVTNRVEAVTEGLRKGLIQV